MVLLLVATGSLTMATAADHVTLKQAMTSVTDSRLGPILPDAAATASTYIHTAADIHVGMT